MFPDPLKLLVITDIHHGIPIGTKQSEESLILLYEFVTIANNSHAQLVIDLGDRINDLDHATDFNLMSDVAERFSKIQYHKEHLIGNHDIHFLSIEENERLLSSNLRSRSLNLCGWHLIFWCPNAKYAPATGFGDDQDSITWLQKDLKKNDKPTIIFCHVPQFPGDLRGNFWFANKPWAASLPYADTILEIIQKDSNVKMTVGGHVHWPRLSTLHGVHHITLPSLIESFFSNGKPCGSWTEITVNDRIDISIYGYEQWRWTLPVRENGLEWPEPRISNIS
jgi:hypothetical protein